MKHEATKHTAVKRIVLIGLVAVTLGVGGLVVRRLFFAGPAETVAEEPALVRVAQPQRSTMEEILRYPGSLSAENTVTVTPKVSGKVVEIHVEEGDAVRPGTLLVTLEEDAIRLQAEQAYAAWQAALAQVRQAERGVRDQELQNARALLSQAEEDLSAAKTNLERSKRLYEAGTIARAQYEEAEQAFNSVRTEVENARRSVDMMAEGASNEELEMARANAEALEAQYELARLQLGRTELSAAEAGTVARIMVDEGNSVGPGVPLLAIVSSDPIYALIAIPERHYGRVNASMAETGRMSARVSPTALPQHGPFQGRVQSVAPVIDPESRTFQVRVRIPNPEGLLKPGMYVNAEIVARRREDIVVVPESAVVVRNDAPVVFRLVEGNSYHVLMTPVEQGMKSGGMVEIKTGLDDADAVVVVEGNAFLEDGQPVRLVGGS